MKRLLSILLILTMLLAPILSLAETVPIELFATVTVGAATKVLGDPFATEKLSPDLKDRSVVFVHYAKMDIGLYYFSIAWNGVSWIWLVTQAEALGVVAGIQEICDKYPVSNGFVLIQDLDK